ncbi:DNA/RNA non-specific endonuclease [Mucilaginibacter gossypii]|uniref:DNA/RNA non-specific endonuclease n=1 Tax=Mucilaginibacter gossypii TaxID=551996 RepID=UPI000DCB38D0|nr:MULTISPECIES: DNA/RNA non-specific endonuclease [Mucilaginibacter]QTE37461.1 DNA/RNA non-specific endonuclease [Mucilaginibacter gossypii]RAV47476.1 hypothetical protein DIU36_29450 [Mucilaginibacter rubeus]
MKKTILLIILSVCGTYSFGQIIKHKLYTTYYNQSTHQPDSVVWDLTPSMLMCQGHLKRLNEFKADPDVPFTNLNKDYKKSGYDQGHQMPAQDNSCDPVGELECFYFSNMVPQRPALNRDTWKNLETYCRKLAMRGPVHIVCGVSGSLGKIGPDKVNIPVICWKKLTYSGHTEYYSMPNHDTVKLHPFQYYLVKKS